MCDNVDRFVPKVHPATRENEADDPMELVATPADGDPNVMLDCVIQEFAWQGYDAKELLRLFLNPEYPALNQLLDAFGPVEVRRRVDELMCGYDAFRVRTRMVETPDPREDDEPELVELTVRHRS